MSTKVEKPLEASPLTHVADMPPLEVVTQGIPPQEHIGPPPAAQVEAPPGSPEHRGRALAWAVAGVMGVLLVAAGTFAATLYSANSASDLGQASTTPFAPSPTGQAPDLVYSGVLRGAALPYIPYWSTPSIEPIEPISVASVEPIAPMSIEPVEPIAPMSIEPIAPMSIPTIEPISIPSTPSTPQPPSTQPMSFPTIEPISIPSLPTISIPSFPTIEPISIPRFPTIQPISIPPFPDM